jgi:hypothetical protein
MKETKDEDYFTNMIKHSLGKLKIIFPREHKVAEEN